MTENQVVPPASLNYVEVATFEDSIGPKTAFVRGNLGNTEWELGNCVPGYYANIEGNLYYLERRVLRFEPKTLTKIEDLQEKGRKDLWIIERKDIELGKKIAWLFAGWGLIVAVTITVLLLTENFPQKSFLVVLLVFGVAFIPPGIMNYFIREKPIEEARKTWRRQKAVRDKQIEELIKVEYPWVNFDQLEHYKLLSCVADTDQEFRRMSP